MTGQDRDREAIGWVLKLRAGGDAADWLAFTEWLEADPANAAAYEAAELADDGLEALAPAEALRAAETRPVSARRWPTRRFVLGGGIAAALAAVVGISTLRPVADPYLVETAAGERRAVDLADGSRIELNGGTRITLDRSDARLARLEHGEALFTVVHDDDDPFVVLAGEARIVDLGTVFNVVHSDSLTEVGVAEGLVSYRQGRDAVELRPGMTMQVADGSAARVSRGAATDVASWRGGRLTYRDATVGRVADDLGRNLGLLVKARPEVAARPFTGVINLDGRADSVPRAAALMGVSAVRREDGAWLLGAEPR